MNSQANARQRSHRRDTQRRTDYLAAIKVRRGCADCGYRAHPVALDFDHRPGETKRMGVSQARKWSWTAIKTEVEKCDVVCANCHRIRTARRRKVEP